MLRKFKENLFKRWISVNTSRLTCVKSPRYFYRTCTGAYYVNMPREMFVCNDSGDWISLNVTVSTKQQFVNAVYKHLTDGTAN